MRPPNNKLSYDKVKVDEWINGEIQEIKYDIEHNFTFKGETNVKPGVRFVFALEGYKNPPGTRWMFFGLGEKTNLFKKYVSNLVEGAKPDMDFDLDELKNLKIKTMWEGDEYQHISMIRPLNSKVVSNDKPVFDEEPPIECGSDDFGSPANSADPEPNDVPF